MNGLKKLAVATAVGAALGLAAGPAAADSVYGGAELLIQDLTIAFSPTTSTVNTFNFGASDSANLLGAPAGTSVTCGGTITNNNCSKTSPVLDATAANAPGAPLPAPILISRSSAPEPIRMPTPNRRSFRPN
jgi:hypothetical protein